MQSFKNAEGKKILLCMVEAIQKNKEYLGEIDGLIGDGDHGMNMNKGFSMFKQRYENKIFSFTDGLENLGNILLTEIGGSMGPIYGTILMEMAETGKEEEDITLTVLTEMLEAGLTGLYDIVDARVGDKTLVDTLSPAIDSLKESAENGENFVDALQNMKYEAEKGKDSTKNMLAKFGRSSRLGKRSIGVLDAGAASCAIILTAMADGMMDIIK